jgi:predicted phage-related endonuclease
LTEPGRVYKGLSGETKLGDGMLTKEALIERRKGIGASDAPKIVSGDWHQLWLEKAGKVEPEDLSWVFPVQLGSVTEELNLRFYAHNTGRVVTRQGEAVISADYPMMRCTLDGFDAEMGAVIEAKHVNGFSKIDEVRARYVPQVTHQMIVCGVQKAILSVIIGTSEPVLELIEFDDFYATDYIEKCLQFWQHVVDDRAPEQGAPIPEPPAPTVMRTVDMSASNVWGNYALVWLKERGAAKQFKLAETELKGLVEPDVRLAEGHGISISRNKAGSLSIKESK